VIAPGGAEEMNGSSREDGGVPREPADFREAAADLGWPPAGVARLPTTGSRRGRRRVCSGRRAAA
jgi:hypothetical protein